MMERAPAHLDHAGVPLAYHSGAGRAPTIVFCGGFMSDMTGTKAMALAAHARARGQAFVRFDYSGHGTSGGMMGEGTISRWLDDTLAILDQVAQGPVLLIGSSMGGWLALLAALARPSQVKALALVAPAPDFTERLMWAKFTADQRQSLLREGHITQPSDYAETPYVITRALIEDGRRHLLLDGPIPLDIPIRILHGQQDGDVPWRLSLELAEKLTAQDLVTSLVKDGDHRLSRPADLARLMAAVDELSAAMAP
ncbi:MAG: alpha/beta hydrolase [Pseudomonadota bacterium]